MKYHVLDHGFIECQDVFGDERTIVNAARVSFGKQKDVLDEKDIHLIQYLVKHKHWSPFRHVFFRFHIKAPEFVMRQWFKHVVGTEWSSASVNQLHGWNEISGRYIELDEFHIPHEWRQQSTSSKQGSDGLVQDQQECQSQYRDTLRIIQQTYRDLIEKGVAKELARLILPLSVYTECIWTVSLQAVLNFISLRTDPHAQQEIRRYATIIETIVKDHFPHVHFQ